MPIFTEKNSKAAKGKTISQETRNISFLESVLEVTTTSNVADSRDTKYVRGPLDIKLSVLIIIIKTEIAILMNK